MRYKFDDFGFIGFDLWQVKGNTIFDNVIITDTWLQVVGPLGCHTCTQLHLA